MPENNEYLEHHGIKGQRWYVRRYQNEDGSLTALGRRRLGFGTKSPAQKKKELLNNPRKLVKNTGKVTAHELQNVLEKAQLAEKLKDVQREGKAKAVEAKQAMTKARQELKNASKQRKEQAKAAANKLKEQKQQQQLLKMQKKQKKQEHQMKKLEKQIKREEYETKKDADKWEKKAKMLTSIVNVSTSLKTLTDDMGLTNKNSGKTIFGAFMSGLGFKVPGNDEKEKKDKKEKSDSGKSPTINITNDFGDLAKVLTTIAGSSSAKETASTVEKTKKDAGEVPLKDAKKAKKESSGLGTFKVSDLSESLGFITLKSGIVAPLFDEKGMATKDYFSNNTYNKYMDKKKKKDGSWDKRYSFSKSGNDFGLKWSEDLNTDSFSHSGLTFSEMLSILDDDSYIMHHGVKNQKWGIRRYQNEDGSLTELGRRRRDIKDKKRELKDLLKKNKATYKVERKNVLNKYKNLKKSKNEKDKEAAQKIGIEKKVIYKNQLKNSSKLSAFASWYFGGVPAVIARRHGIKTDAERQWVLRNNKNANAAQKAVEKARKDLLNSKQQYKKVKHE